MYNILAFYWGARERHLPEINSEALNNFIHSYYIVIINMIVVSIDYFRLIASSYWIPTLTRQGNVL